MCHRARGVLRDVSEGSLTIEGRDHQAYQIRSSAIESLEVSLGRSHGRGAMQGLGLGALAGALAFGAYAMAGPEEGGAGPPRELAFVLGGVGGGVLGLVVGAAIGVERWDVVR